MRSPTANGRRFAIYFAPPADSPLHRFGSACLGRDVATGAELSPPVLDGLTAERWRQIARSPLMYGFHATLKPPFHLAGECDPEDLVQRLERFAALRQPFESSPLRVARISNFLALVLRAESTALSDLASACVCGFDNFRAPPAPDELARRRRAPLTPRQQELLAAWGYPYVLDEWRFHMTLASGLERTEADHLRLALDRAAAPLCSAPLLVDAVCLFEQPAPDAPFRLARRFPFGGGAPRHAE